MALLFTGLVLAAIAPPATMAAQTTAPRAARPRRICRDVSRVGSRLRSYRCLTEAEWADLNRQNADKAREVQNDAERNGRADANYGPAPI